MPTFKNSADLYHFFCGDAFSISIHLGIESVWPPEMIFFFREKLVRFYPSAKKNPLPCARTTTPALNTPPRCLQIVPKEGIRILLFIQNILSLFVWMDGCNGWDRLFVLWYERTAADRWAPVAPHGPSVGRATLQNECGWNNCGRRPDRKYQKQIPPAFRAIQNRATWRT